MRSAECKPSRKPQISSDHRDSPMRLITTPAPLLRAATTTRYGSAPMMLDAASILANPSADPVATAFEFVTLVPQPFWLLLVLVPNWKGTRFIFEPIWPLALLCLAHSLVVYLSTQVLRK